MSILHHTKLVFVIVLGLGSVNVSFPECTMTTKPTPQETMEHGQLKNGTQPSQASHMTEAGKGEGKTSPKMPKEVILCNDSVCDGAYLVKVCESQQKRIEELEAHQTEIDFMLKDVGGTQKVLAMRKAFPDEHRTRTEMVIRHEVELKRMEKQCNEAREACRKLRGLLLDMKSHPCNFCNNKGESHSTLCPISKALASTPNFND